MSTGGVVLPSRRDPTVAAIVRRWRLLTSGRRPSGRPGSGEPTLLACSGGADSCALALALAAASRRLVIAHVVHDMRPANEALADRDSVQMLAHELELPFVCAHVSIRDHTIDGAPPDRPGASARPARNAEAAARNLRYTALAGLARHAGIEFVATAHHAGDQLETILMGLMRGAGPAGLRGIAERRPLALGGSRVTIVRPMLAIGRSACEEMCRDAGWAWTEDTTNADTTRLRSFLRHKVIPCLRDRSAGIETRAARTSRLCRDATGLAQARAREIVTPATGGAASPPSTISVKSATLREAGPLVAGFALRMMIHHVAGESGADRIGGRQLDPILEALQSPVRRPRVWRLHATEVRLTSREISVCRI